MGFRMWGLGCRALNPKPLGWVSGFVAVVPQSPVELGGRTFSVATRVFVRISEKLGYLILESL